MQPSVLHWMLLLMRPLPWSGSTHGFRTCMYNFHPVYVGQIRTIFACSKSTTLSAQDTPCHASCTLFIRVYCVCGVKLTACANGPAQSSKRMLKLNAHCSSSVYVAQDGCTRRMHKTDAQCVKCVNSTNTLVPVSFPANLVAKSCFRSCTEVW